MRLKTSHILILFSILAVLFAFKLPNNGKSRLLLFNHIGFGDTIFAFVDGRVVNDVNKQLTGIGNVKVYLTTSNSNIIDSVTSDRQGNYSLKSSFKRIFRIVFQKSGYESLTIDNYECWPDMYSTMDVALEKGDDAQYYFLPDSIQYNGKFTH